MSAVPYFLEQFSQSGPFGGKLGRIAVRKGFAEQAWIAAGLAQPQQGGEHGHAGLAGGPGAAGFVDFGHAFALDGGVHIALGAGHLAADNFLDL